MATLPFDYSKPPVPFNNSCEPLSFDVGDRPHSQQQQIVPQNPHRPPALAIGNPQSAYGSTGSIQSHHPPHQSDYSYENQMSRVANAAYTKAMNDAVQIQMMAAASQRLAAPQQQPIIIQNTTKAVAESQNESTTIQASPPMLQQPPQKPSFLEQLLNVFQGCWQSKLNRILLIELTGAGLYLY